MVDWANTLIALAGAFLAVIALHQTRKANLAAADANDISRAANELSENANRVAERALQLQEEDGKVRLIVEPRLMCIIGEGEDNRPRPVVRVVNLSSFPVIIDGIHWKSNRGTNGHFFWKNPTVANPFEKLPARLAPREALTALGTPTSFKTLEDLASITAAVAYTACGEKFEGMTGEWKVEVAKMVSEVGGPDE